MLKKIIKKLPGMKDYYQHLQRRKLINELRRRKKLPWDEKLKMVEETYFERVGHKLDWNELHTYTEKMQWAKLFDLDPRKTLLADKYAARAWVAEKVGEEHLIPLLGVWDSFDEIDFDSLPDQFVLKTNNGCATNLIVKDKSKLNLKKTRRLVNDWLDMEFSYYNPFEFHYAAIPPKIIAEKFMSDGSGDLADYKFFCFGGEPKFCWIDINRYSDHRRNIYDMDWVLQPWKRKVENSDVEIPRPKEFDEMKRIVTALAEGFSHVRVDVYLVGGQVYFGEMTFTSGSGFGRFTPDSADLMLGDLWELDTTKQEARAGN